MFNCCTSDLYYLENAILYDSIILTLLWGTSNNNLQILKPIAYTNIRDSISSKQVVNYFTSFDVNSSS